MQIKKLQSFISRILFSLAGMLSFICSQHCCGDESAYPGTRSDRSQIQKRAALEDSYMWHFSTQGLPVITVPGYDRKLLPYVFTLIPNFQDGYFLWHYLNSNGSELPDVIGMGLLYTVRTFLILVSQDTIAPLCSQAKIQGRNEDVENLKSLRQKQLMGKKGIKQTYQVILK